MPEASGIGAWAVLKNPAGMLVGGEQSLQSFSQCVVAVTRHVQERVPLGGARYFQGGLEQ